LRAGYARGFLGEMKTRKKRHAKDRGMVRGKRNRGREETTSSSTPICISHEERERWPLK